MATPIKYRISSVATKPTADSVKGAPLTSLEIDGNFRSLKDSVEALSASDGAALVGNTPTGTIAATTVQGAINEIVSDLAASSGSSLVGYLPAGTGAVATTVQSKLRESVSVLDFGAVGDGVADDTAAIQAALNYCNTFSSSENKPFLSGAPGTYLVSSTLTISCDCDLSSMLIVANGSSVSPVIRVGGMESNQITWFKKIALPKIKNNSRAAGQWGAGTGVQFTNCNTCDITIPAIQYFAVGADFSGYSQGFAYNTITLQYIYDNKVNVRLKPVDAGGWTNQNTFIGGRLGYTPSLFSGTTNVGSRNILLEQWDTSLLQAGGPNNNTFLNTSIEGDAFPEYSIDIQGGFNIFQGCRYEGVAAKNVRLFSQATAGTDSNLFIGGYQAYGLTVTKQGAGTSVNNSLISGRTNRISANGVAFSITVGSGSSPHIQGFRASQDAIEKSLSSTDWTYRVYESSAAFKADSDAYARAVLDYSSGNYYFSNGTLASPTSYIGPYGTSAIRCSATFQPVVDNTTALGSASFRWSVLYAGSGVINTSDGREKQDVADLDDAEKRVAAALKGLVKKFRFKDAVAAKGDNARIHIGVIAQEVMSAFQAEGLDPMRYAIVCYDEWDAELDDDGNQIRPAGNRYGIRYEELLAFIIAAL